MYKVLKNVRLNGVTYEKGTLVKEIPDSKYKHCFEKEARVEKKIKGKKVETAAKKIK